MRRAAVPLGAAIAIIVSVVAPAGAAPARGEHPCGARREARCGTVTVPLDRAHPEHGTLRIGYERYPRTDRSRPELEPIVAIEGGPGFPSTASRGYYLGLFRPMMDRHELLLVDLRGTGTSEPIDCRRLQGLRLVQYDRWVQAVGACGRQLGPASDLYGTANAADDLAHVLHALGLGTVDLYGDSYGTFFAQTFAVRHPGRLRALILDGAYPVEGADPWSRDQSRAAADGFRWVCERDPGCSAVGGDPIHRLGVLARRVARHPIIGSAPDADGQVRRTTVDPGILVYLFTAAGSAPDLYRELDAAVRAALRPHPDDRPILRLARETVYLGGGGPVKWYSQGLASAVSCNDYPQVYDMMSPPRVRVAAYPTTVRRLERHDPAAYAPFTVEQWLTSPVEDVDSCLRWPVPDHPLPPLPPGHTYPHVPTLVMVGDLDSVTSPEGAQQVAANFPDATFVTVANMTHVPTLGDRHRCASRIVLRFVRRLSGGDTSCAAEYAEVRAVDAFPRLASGLAVGSERRRAAAVAANTVADVVARWGSMGGTHGVGLRGGSFVTSGRAVVRWTLSGVRWVKDVAVSGSVSWNRGTGSIRAAVTLRGSGTPEANLELTWNDLASLAQADVHGRLGDGWVHLRIAAP